MTVTQEQQQRPWLLAIIAVGVVGFITIGVYFAGFIPYSIFKIVIVAEIVAAILVVMKYVKARQAIVAPGRRVARR